MTHPHRMTPLIFLKDNLACPKCHGLYLGLCKLYLWFNEKFIIDLEMMSMFQAWLATCVCVCVIFLLASVLGWATSAGLEPSGTCWKVGIKESNRFLMLSFSKWKNKMKSVLNNSSIRSRVGLFHMSHGCMSILQFLQFNFFILCTIFLIWAP